MTQVYGLDAYAPAEVARRVQAVGVVKARLPLLQLVLLGVLAGAFIGLGSLVFTLVRSDASLGYAQAQVLGGVVFALGLLLVVVAGAELFTGNNLLAMAWAGGQIGTGELLRNWLVVGLANALGAAGLAVLVYLSGHGQLNDGAVGRQVVALALAKQDLPWGVALVRGLLCNVLVCMAVWMAMAGRSVVDKAVAVVPPVAAFVAAGFEHSIANFYFFPLAWLLQQGQPVPGQALLTVSGAIGNLVPVILGNLIGGSVLVALTYHVIYRRGAGVEPAEG